MNLIDKQALDKILDQAIAEDLGAEGDVTSEALFPHDQTVQAVIRSKSSGIISGMYLLKPLYTKISPKVQLSCLVEDGDAIEPGLELAQLAGPIKPILAAERIALNFLQHLSGIATSTAKMVSAISHTKAKILDTRKTTPLLRMLQKQAVVHGGGYNHRFGLFDMILIKSTHVKACGGPSVAISRALEYAKKKKLLIEIEVGSREEFIEAAKACPNRIMLDNMSLEDMQFCVSCARSLSCKIELEASGNVSLANIKAIAETGVDYISCGSLTHSFSALDIHLVIK